MISKLFKTNKGKEFEKDVPSNWHDITLGQFVKLQILKQNDPEYLPKLLEIMTGIEKDKWLSGDAVDAGLAYNLLSWVEDEALPESIQQMIISGNKIQEININEDKTNVEKRIEIQAILDDYKQHLPSTLIINEKPVEVPQNLLNPALAVILDIENAINTHQGEGVELFPGVLACLLHAPYTKGKYNKEHAMKLLPEIEKLKAWQVTPIAYFFLESLSLNRRFGKKGFNHSARKVNRRKHRAFNRFRRG